MKIAYTRPDGKLRIVFAAPKASLERVFGTLTDEQYRAHVLERSIPDDAEDIRELPDDWKAATDRTFRGAWKMRSDLSIEVDMPRARDIHRKRIRKRRERLLQELDVAALRALEAQDATTAGEVAARKQKLRDAPAHPAIDAAATPDELKSLTLEALTL